MKKFIFLFSFVFVTLGASSQNITLWYGVNYGKETNTLYDYGTEWRFANFGLDYTAQINKSFDWTVGLGYNSKGCSYKANYIQAEGNVGYNVVKAGKFSLQPFTGPFMAVAVKRYDSSETMGYNDNSHYVEPSRHRYNAFSCGWQVGVQLCYSRVALKTGFEQAFTNVDDGSKTYEWFIRLGVRL